VKKSFLILFISSLSQLLLAQIPTIYSTTFPDSSSISTGIIGEYGINANAFTTQFLSKFYSGGYIDSNLKNQVLDKTKNKNRIGADINYGIFAAFKLDSLFHKKDFSVFISLRDRQHFDASYSKDFYKVGFYGNAAYAGKTADFNGFNLNLIRYQQLQIGLFSSKLDSAARWGIGISLLKGEQYASIYAKKAELFTSEDGQYIDFNTNIQAAQSDTAKKGMTAFNGIGASIDIYFEAPFKTKIGDSKLTFSVADIGLIQFNSNTLYMNQDSLFHYTGFNVNTIYDLQDSTFSGLSQDSIINSIAPFKKQKVNVTLPSTLNLIYSTNLSSKFTLSEGIRYVFNGNYNLLVYVKANYFFNKHFALNATVGHGGYGNFCYGIGMYASINKGFNIYVGSNNLEGLIAPKKTAGQGAYISLIKNFN
jgi:hypothetical protein